jgi:hypothetical protein
VETFKLQSKPSVDQMLELQKLGVVMAKNQKKLKQSRKKENAHIFLAREIEHPEAESSMERFSTYRFTGRVARTGFRRWSMKIVEAFWTREIAEFSEDIDDQERHEDDGYRASYSFAWTDKEVLKSIKNVRPKKLYHQENYQAERPIDILEGIETEVATWEQFHKIGIVSMADCELLINSMRDFGQTSQVLLNTRNSQPVGL